MPLAKEVSANKASVSPVSKRWQSSHFLWASIVLPVILFFSLITVIEILVREQQWRAENAQTQQLISSTNEIRSLFDYELNSTLHLTSGLISYVQSKQGVLVEAELNPWLTNLQERGKHIRNIGIAPNNKISYVYPLAGNEAALGLYYPDNKEQWPEVRKTILGRKPVLAGPLDLRQGGRGLIYRVPVYLDNTGYWGLVSTVLNFDELYKIVRQRADQLGIKLAIQDIHPGTDKQKVLFGDSSIVRSYTHSMNLDIPGRQWQMLVAPVSEKVTDKLQPLRIGGWLTTLMLAILLFYYLRSVASQQLTSTALDESQYRFSQVFNTSPQGMALVNYRGDWLDFNDSLCTTLGYTREQLNQLTLFKLLTVEQQLHISRIIDSQNLHAVANNQHEATLLHESGEPINVILSLAPMRNESDLHRDWIVQIIDISHRVTVEKLLQEEANYGQAILNAVVDGIMTIDRRGVIRSANPATEAIFEGNKDQIIGKNINHFFQEPYASIITQHIRHHKNDADINVELNNEITGLKSHGAIFPLEIHFSWVHRKSEKIFIAVVRDISERKRLDKMKNEFISIVSHELRTPLTAIIGSLSLLDTGALGQFTDQAKKMIRIAHKNGKKLSFLINDLLDMDKLVAGKMQFDFKIQPVVPVILQAIESNASYAEQYQVAYEFSGSADQVLVNVDSYRLQQVLSNLLSNAAKFSPPESVVKIHADKIEKFVRIAVIDKGPGISTAAQAQLFDKFYQVDSSSARQKNGTGLGLAIAKELVEFMQGKIGVTSTEGNGSCFFIELPYIENNSEGQA